MKQHLIAALILVVAYALVALFVVKFDPQATPLWLTPMLFAWVITLGGTIDGNATAKRLSMIFYGAMLAVLGAALVAMLRTPGNYSVHGYFGLFILAVMSSGVIAYTRIFYDEKVFGSSRFATHAIALGQFALLAVTLPSIQ